MPRLMRLALIPVTLLCLLAAAAPAAHAQADTRPNIVFVMTDDQTVESLKVMSRVRGALGGAGTNFTGAISTYPLCCPSRATYLTGQYSHNHGVIHNAGPSADTSGSTTRTPCPCGSSARATARSTWAAT